MMSFGNVKVAPPRHQCRQRWAWLVNRILAISGGADHVTGVSSASKFQIVNFLIFYLHTTFLQRIGMHEMFATNF